MSEETYGLDWPGKRAARELAQEPPTGRLVEEDRAGSANVIAEGDSLEVLKLLRDGYAGAVKAIYVDPPYNTGSSFVYADDFAGHAAWLSMIYPRLIVARDLMRQDGVGFVSIDGNEVAQLRLVLEEVFGPGSVLATIVWVNNLKGRQIGDGGPVGTHEYIVCFAKDASRVGQFRASVSELRALMPVVYKNPDYPVRYDDRGAYVTKNWLHNTNSRFNERTAPTLVYRIHVHPGTGDVRVSDIDDDTTYEGYLTAMPHPNARPGISWHAWRWSRAKVLAEHAELEFDTSGDRLRIRTKVRDVDRTALKDLVIGPTTQTGQQDLAALGLDRLFETPKPVALIEQLIAVSTGPDDLVLDFFAGSGTTAEAVLRRNAVDGGHRQFVLVQLDEPCRPGSAAADAGYPTIAALCRERVRRAGGQFRALRVEV